MLKVFTNYFRSSLKRKRQAWYLYDWANSAYSTTVITLFLGPFLTELAKSVSKNNLVSIFGVLVPAGSIFPYSISISVLLQAFFLPLVGAIADYTKYKNLLLALFTFIGAVSTILFFVISGNIFLFGAVLLIISNVSFGASVVIYNSLLNEISTVNEREEVSSKGWAVGYIGGGLLLIFNLLIFTNNQSLGISQDFSVRLNIALAGIWWGLFSLPVIFAFSNSKKANKGNTGNFSKKIFANSFKQLIGTFKDAKNYPITLMFLLAYLFYNDGVQSVISLSSQFGQEELHLNMLFLTIVILVVQFVAAFGAILFLKLSKMFSEKKSILIAITIWIFIIIYAFGFLKGQTDFFILAMCIAIVMGGIQSISRSLYSKLIPQSKESEYFSIYEISEKGTSWLGPFAFGLTYQLTFSYRFAILSLLIFFLIGGLILFFTKVNPSKELI
jgi:UMF1 family MFS transporter